MEEINLEQIKTKAADIYAMLPLWAWASIGGFLLLLIIIRMVSRASRKKKLKAISPKLLLHAYQVAPLGRDAFFKLRNIGEKATLTALNIHGRNDIKVKNIVAGHELEKEKVYSILLEATGQQKLDKNFSLELTFFDVKGNTYKQFFPLDQNTAKQAKLIRRR